MADILVYNALKEVHKALNVGNLGVSETDIKTAVNGAIANPTLSSFVKRNALERLSCLQQVSHCCCNYAGSGYYGGVGGSLWSTMSTEVIPVVSLYDKLSTTSQFASIAQMVDSFESVTIRNNLIQYIELYAKSVIDTSSAALKNYWLSNTPSSFKVCSASYNAGVGATCTWTVPTGTTRAKFQVWGAGVGTNPGCCCGGSPFGANGAYAELVVGVTAGQQYVICAGCSCAINCCSNSYPGCACMSGVTGPAICCLKADGGSSFNCCIMNCASTLLTGTGICHRISNFYCAVNSGGCWCSYGEYCASGSCATCGIIAVYPSCADSNGNWCACGTTTAQIYKDGHKSLHGGGCFDTGHYGYMVRPPIIDADTCKEFVGGCSCATFTSENCLGGCLGDGWTRHPGMGGAYTHVMAGFTTHLGGKGTGGMVKVSWE